MTKRRASFLVALAILLGSLLIPLRASFVWAALPWWPVGGPFTINPLRGDPDVQAIMAALEEPDGTVINCQTGRDLLLKQLDRLRTTRPDLFDHLDYGPITIPSNLFIAQFLPSGHDAVVLYDRNAFNRVPAPPNSATEQQIEDYYNRVVSSGSGVVLEYTNWMSTWAHIWAVRDWSDWRALNDGHVDRNYRTTYWRFPGGPLYPPPPQLPVPTPGLPGPQPQPAPGPGCQLATVSTSLTVRVVQARDPNDKVGLPGVGAPRFISGLEPLPYVVHFENLPAATAPAQTVVVTDQLNPTTMDLGTFSLGPMTFSNHTVTPPPGLAQFTTTVDLRPGNNLLVRIEASLNPGTNVVTWRFTSLDPATNQPTTDPLAGFLPPNLTPPHGQGSVLFTVMPRPGLTTNTTIGNSASIVFDTNKPIVTGTWVNTIDTTLPTSQVQPLAATQNAATFPVAWDGTDAHAGIQDYTIFVSENGGPFGIWLQHTPLVMADYVGQPGRTYRFYSIARDRVGNVEPTPALADSITSVLGTPSPTLRPGLRSTPTQSPTDATPIPASPTLQRETAVVPTAPPTRAARTTPTPSALGR